MADDNTSMVSRVPLNGKSVTVWEAIKKAIQENEHFLLCTHRFPDADGVGAELGLFQALETMGKKPVILNPDSLPHILQFMDPDKRIVGFDCLPGDKAVEMLNRAQVIFMLDAGFWGRLAELGAEVHARDEKLLVIDHHPVESSSPPPGSVINDRASSTGEMIYELLSELEHPIDDRIAFCLYCAIIKDTGCFRFENTNAKVLGIASRLAGFDIVPCEIYDLLFERNSISSVHCLAETLSTLRLSYNNRLASIHLSQELLERTGTDIEETEVFINIIRSIDAVEACLYFREVPGNKVRISLRSKTSRIDVRKLAGEFGGGGHKRASGAMVSGSLKEVEDKVVATAAMYFDGGERGK
ncbi:MAG: bifunctional oligoribonuclease/PAP phosphatase NrnA [Gemmatimonadota bacterium]|nr:bifunctional oligoribonuclease/PAP phosphatase NrnA [Gemmatimonadota bacterium]